MMFKFIRGLIVALAIVVAWCNGADAQTLTYLAPPAQAPVTGSKWYGCSGNSFDAADNISGSCRARYVSGCSGRGCTPVTIYYFYNMTWAAGGVPGAGDLCQSVRYHAPQTPVTTFYNGHIAGDCQPMSWWESTVVTINGVPYYYATTSADGAYEIVNSNAASYLVTF